MRFVHNLKASREHHPKRTGLVSKEDFIDAENYIYRQSQSNAYADEIALLESNRLPHADKVQQIDKTSPIYRHNPYLDENGVIRAKGRIDAACGVCMDTKRPILLPKGDRITDLIIRYYHANYVNLNGETVVNVALKSIVRSCQICKNRTAEPIPPLMGNLPTARLMSYTRPFTYMGTDYFGPMNVSGCIK